MRTTVQELKNKTRGKSWRCGKAKKKKKKSLQEKEERTQLSHDLSLLVLDLEPTQGNESLCGKVQAWIQRCKFLYYFSLRSYDSYVIKYM